MNQLFLGGFVPFVLAALVYAFRGCRATFGMLAAVPLAVAAGMLWAVAPDLPRLVPGGMRLYQELAVDPRCDLFLWHYTIDGIEGYSILYPSGLVVMFGSMVLAAWRELKFIEGE